MNKYMPAHRLILLVSFLTLQGTNFANASGELTCPDELASYQECIANQPLYCFPTCGKVQVRVQPEDLTYMMDPSYTCNPMKLASCAMRGCCEQCSAQEATYWSCIERESGCGEIDCQAILAPNDGDTSTEPQDEEVPPDEDETTTQNTGGSDGQVTDTSDEDTSTGDAPAVADDGTNDQQPLENNNSSGTDNSNSSGGSNSSTLEDFTCPGELGLFKQCVANNTLTCAPACANVDVTLKAEDLTNVFDPSVLCTPMEAASCAQRSCCEECALEEVLYWFCIERETGCGAFDCRYVPDLIDVDTDSEPQEDQTPPADSDEVTATGGSGTPTVNNTSNGDAAPSDSDCDCESPSQNNNTKPTTGDEQDVVVPASDEDTDSAIDQPLPQNTTTDEKAPVFNNTTNSSTTNQDISNGVDDNTNGSPVGSNTSSSNSGGLTCPDELANYQQCIANQPLYCFPTCGQVQVRVQPEDLVYMMDPSLKCDPMKLASCAMRDCCTQCADQEATYWSCIERESGCGEIDCQAILDPIDGKPTPAKTSNSNRNPEVADFPEFDAIEGTGDEPASSNASQTGHHVAWFGASISLFLLMNL